MLGTLTAQASISGGVIGLANCGLPIESQGRGVVAKVRGKDLNAKKGTNLSFLLKKSKKLPWGSATLREGVKEEGVAELTSVAVAVPEGESKEAKIMVW